MVMGLEGMRSKIGDDIVNMLLAQANDLGHQTTTDANPGTSLIHCI
jgi:hypothetical protein